MCSRLYIGLVVVSLAACNSASSQQAAAEQRPSVQPPTATEVFTLRSRCAELGQNILENNVIGVALTQDQKSHYDPKTNRCYVELTVQTADLNSPVDYLSRTLYDGQTHELLAFATLKNGTKSASVFVKAEPTSLNPYDGANDYINRIMEDDRKQ